MSNEVNPLTAQASPAPERRCKQVIVMRHDLGMRRGKQIAQGAHAGLAFLMSRLRTHGALTLEHFSDQQRQWLAGGSAKICCRVDSEEALLDVRDRAVDAGLEVHVITDSGKTEFGGVPTLTCLAIGPDDAERIDEITGDLKLL